MTVIEVKVAVVLEGGDGNITGGGDSVGEAYVGGSEDGDSDGNEGGGGGLGEVVVTVVVMGLDVVTMMM